MRAAKMMINTTVEIVLSVPEETPIGSIEFSDAELEEMNRAAALNGERVIDLAVIAAEVVEI
jgi:hypothetical protein